MTITVIRKIRLARDSDDLCIKLHLFRSARGAICGWYIGPVSISAAGVSLPYLPKSDEARATVAAVRAIAAAERSRRDLCLIDPDDLWDPAWRE